MHKANGFEVAARYCGLIGTDANGQNEQP
ncbi:MAG: hypothetical protein QOD76_560, partial [Solirubrobacteraceae bacterium]|nr:hypothetical protein [Solirubrobacteraceae bacterium]